MEYIAQVNFLLPTPLWHWNLSANWFHRWIMHFGLFQYYIHKKQLLHVHYLVLKRPNHKRCMCSFIQVIMVPVLLVNKYSPAILLREYSKVGEFLEENCVEKKRKKGTVMWDPFLILTFGFWIKWLVWG